MDRETQDQADERIANLQKVVMGAHLGHDGEPMFSKFPLNTAMFSGNFKIVAQAIQDDLPERDFFIKLDAAGARKIYEVCQKSGAAVSYYEFTEAYYELCSELGLTPDTDDGIFEPVEFFDKVSELYRVGIKRGKSTGWICVDQIYTVVHGELVIVHGWPGRGKSEWLDALMVNLFEQHDYKFGVFSQNYPPELHLSKLAEKHLRKPFFLNKDRMEEPEAVEAISYLNRHMRIVYPSERQTSLEYLLEKFDKINQTFKLDAIIIDPWNEIEHQMERFPSETAYIAYALMKLRRFGREHNITVFVVQHPQKINVPPDEELPCPSPRHLSGSAHWQNKADDIIAIHRSMKHNPEIVEVHIQKIKHKPTGRIGNTMLKYNNDIGTYEEYYE